MTRTLGRMLHKFHLICRSDLVDKWRDTLLCADPSSRNRVRILYNGSGRQQDHCRRKFYRMGRKGYNISHHHH